MAHHRLGDTAQQQAINAPAPMTADDDEVRRPVFSCLHDLGRRLADVNKFKRRRLQRGALSECGKQSFAVLLSQSDEFACRNPTFGSISNNGGIDDMNYRHLTPERTRQTEPDIRRILGENAMRALRGAEEAAGR